MEVPLDPGFILRDNFNGAGTREIAIFYSSGTGEVKIHSPGNCGEYITNLPMACKAEFHSWAEGLQTSWKTTRPPRMFWYEISFMACPLSSSEFSRNLLANPCKATSSREKWVAYNEKNLLNDESLEMNVVISRKKFMTKYVVLRHTDKRDKERKWTKNL